MLKRPEMTKQSILPPPRVQGKRRTRICGTWAAVCRRAAPLAIKNAALGMRVGA
jgi:hypothetical protein